MPCSGPRWCKRSVPLNWFRWSSFWKKNLPVPMPKNWETEYMSWLTFFTRTEAAMPAGKRPRYIVGYRPGATLKRVLLDIGDRCTSQIHGAEAELTTADGTVHVQERVHAQSMMHVVTLEFSLDIPCVPVSVGTVDIRHAGMFRRQALEWRVKQGACGDFQSLLMHVSSSDVLSQALMQLDFQRCQLHANAIGYQLKIEHYGASEVVTRLPALRRYIRLTPVQRNALLSVFVAFHRLLQV